MAVDRSWRWIAWLVLGIGALILAGGLALGWGSLRHVLYAERADGEIMRDPPRRRHVRARGALSSAERRDAGSDAILAAARPTSRWVIGSPSSTCRRIPADFRIDTFDRLWFSAIFVTVFACFWLLFGAIAWAMSREADLLVVGERAFAVIAGAAAVIGIFVLWNAVALYTGGARAEGTVLEIRENAADRAGRGEAGRRPREAARRRADRPTRRSCASPRARAARSSSMAAAAAARPSPKANA